MPFAITKSLGLTPQILSAVTCVLLKCQITGILYIWKNKKVFDPISNCLGLAQFLT